MTRNRVLVIAGAILAVVVAAAIIFDSARVFGLSGRVAHQQMQLAGQQVQLRAEVRQIQTLEEQNRLIAGAALNVTAAIQAERDASIRRSCQQLNSRHKHTIRVLNRIYARALRHAPRRRRGQLRASRAASMLIISQLAPYHNCARVVAAATAQK